MSWATVTALRQLTPTVTEIVLHLDPTARLDFGPGQWCDLRAPGVELLGGSMTSLPSELPELCFAVKRTRYPPAKWVTTEAAVGDRVQLRVGGELADGMAKRSLFIAGGIGITPLYALAQQASNQQGRRAALLYSSRSLEELCFASELREMERRSDFFLEMSTTREQADEQHGCHQGRIDEKKIDRAVTWLGVSDPEHQDMDVYICGPPGMTEDMIDLCIQYGIPESKINFERWW